MIQNLVKSPIRKVESNIYSCLDHSSKASYDRKARVYEFLVGNFIYNKVMWGTSPRDYVHYAREVLAACEGSVVDVGCGGLVQTARLYAKRPQYTILADISLKMLRIGKQRILQQNGLLSEQLTFLQADAFKLPLYAGAVDNVVSFGMLHLFDNKQAFIQEFLRILQRKQEFATAMSSKEIIELFQRYTTRIQHYTIGSMVFI
ncbi:MAG: class I SAM-dependent methyltransferase, partial [Chitinophagaceae bacterium]